MPPSPGAQPSEYRKYPFGDGVPYPIWPKFLLWTADGFREFGAAGNAEFGVDTAQVVVHGPDGQAEAGGDLPAGPAVGGEPGHLVFPAGQAHPEVDGGQQRSARAPAAFGEKLGAQG